MATRSSIADEKTAVGVRATPTAGGILRYQLNVVACTPADVVRSAGGWLLDSARAGWDVNVMVADGGAPRSLAILGATTLDFAEDFVSMFRNAARVGALAVSADLLGTDARVRD